MDNLQWNQYNNWVWPNLVFNTKHARFSVVELVWWSDKNVRTGTCKNFQKYKWPVVKPEPIVFERDIMYLAHSLVRFSRTVHDPQILTDFCQSEAAKKSPF